VVLEYLNRSCFSLKLSFFEPKYNNLKKLTVIADRKKAILLTVRRMAGPTRHAIYSPQGKMLNNSLPGEALLLSAADLMGRRKKSSIPQPVRLRLAVASRTIWVRKLQKGLVPKVSALEMILTESPQRHSLIMRRHSNSFTSSLQMFLTINMAS
jgi:hypothetical protein